MRRRQRWERLGIVGSNSNSNSNSNSHVDRDGGVSRARQLGASYLSRLARAVLEGALGSPLQVGEAVATVVPCLTSPFDEIRGPMRSLVIHYHEQVLRQQEGQQGQGSAAGGDGGGAGGESGLQAAVRAMCATHASDMLEGVHRTHRRGPA